VGSVLQALLCPTLVVWGKESDVLSEAHARPMVDVLPRGDLVAVPDLGHSATLVTGMKIAVSGVRLGPMRS
jgi:pimeloyl-ACP methyl ester carboxylesterase